MSALVTLLREWLGQPTPAPARPRERPAPILNLDSIFDEVAHEDRVAALAPLCRPEHER